MLKSKTTGSLSLLSGDGSQGFSLRMHTCACEKIYLQQTFFSIFLWGKKVWTWTDPGEPGAVSMGTQIPWLPGSTASAYSLPHLGGHRNSALISSLSKSGSWELLQPQLYQLSREKREVLLLWQKVFNLKMYSVQGSWNKVYLVFHGLLLHHWQ